MKFLGLLTSDESSLDKQTGKLSITGVYNEITSYSFPAIHPRLFVTLVLGNTDTESDKEHRISVVIEKDGENIATYEDDKKIGRRHYQIVIFQNVLFKSAGEHTIRATVDKDSLSTTLILKLIEGEATKQIS